MPGPEFWTDEERRHRMEDLARQLTADRPPLRVLDRVRAVVRRLVGDVRSGPHPRA